MLTLDDLRARLVATLDDAEIAERYQAGDPLVVQQVNANAAFLVLLSQDIDISTIEPFIKTRDRSIIADATNKGILPVATPCQHILEVINSGATSRTLTQGRMIEDSQGGRPWRLLSSVTVDAGETGEVTVEQSELREVVFAAVFSEAFRRVPLDITDGLFLSAILVTDEATPTPNIYPIAPRWMNVAAGDYAINVTTDSLRRIIVEFGDTLRAGRTLEAADVIHFLLTESYGFVDAARLKDASLIEVLTGEERLRVRFKLGGLVRAGADPLSISQLRLLASYPALYDENAVFLGNFDYLARKKFMARSDYVVVWNESVQDRIYGATLDDINHLNVTVVAKNPVDQIPLENDIKLAMARADTLYDGRVNVRAAVEREYVLTVTGRLAAQYEIDTVADQIRALLLDKYGKGTIAASHWLPDGVNLQEASTLVRNNIQAFQDRISDFSLSGEDLSLDPIKPHEWTYLTSVSIVVNLTRTADTGNTLWSL